MGGDDGGVGAGSLTSLRDSRSAPPGLPAMMTGDGVQREQRHVSDTILSAEDTHAWRIVASDFELSSFLVDLTWRGTELSVAGDYRLVGRIAYLDGLHVQGLGTNEMGQRRLMSLIHWAIGYLDVDEIRIAGASRTSGANPGRIPRPFIVRRDGSRRFGD